MTPAYTPKCHQVIEEIEISILMEKLIRKVFSLCKLNDKGIPLPLLCLK